MDYASLLFDPIYSIQGVPAAITLASGTLLDGLTGLDKTSGVDVGGGDVQIQTIVPAAIFRVRELREKGAVPADLPKASLIMNGFEWRVNSYRLKPSPKGEHDGEVLLLLSQKRELSSESEAEFASEP